MEFAACACAESKPSFLGRAYVCVHPSKCCYHPHSASFCLFVTHSGHPQLLSAAIRRNSAALYFMCTAVLLLYSTACAAHSHASQHMLSLDLNCRRRSDSNLNNRCIFLNIFALISDCRPQWCLELLNFVREVPPSRHCTLATRHSTNFAKQVVRCYLQQLLRFEVCKAACGAAARRSSAPSQGCMRRCCWPLFSAV